MAKRKIVWTKTAAKQRREVLRYWTSRNRSTAYPEKLIKLNSERINIILLHLEAYKSSIYLETKISAMGHFSILYKLTESNLIITSFWDNRQDPKTLLKIISN